jgi:hypothetical protein
MRNALQRGFSIILLTMAAAGAASAQYDAPREYGPIEDRYLSVGAMPRDFAPRASFTGADSTAIRYNVWMPTIGFHQKSMDAVFGYTRYTLGGAKRTAAYFGASVSNDMPLVQSRPFSLAIPILVSLDYTKSESSGAQREDFNMASVGIGTGLQMMIASPGLEFNARIGGAYHFAFEGWSTGNGSSAAVFGDATLIVRTLSVVDGLVFGYRFRHQTWNAGDGRLNYRVTTHGPYIGVLL